MDEYALHTQCIGNKTGMLTARTAKAVHGVFGHVIAALDADFLDCIGHVFHSNSQKTFSDFLNGQPIAYLYSHGFEFLTHNIHIERLICIWTKHGREKIGLKFAKQDITISDSEGTAASISSRPGVCTSAFGTDLHAAITK